MLITHLKIILDPIPLGWLLTSYDQLYQIIFQMYMFGVPMSDFNNIFQSEHLVTWYDVILYKNIGL